MAAPLPPPAMAPMIAPTAAPPPTYLPVRLLAPIRCFSLELTAFSVRIPSAAVPLLLIVQRELTTPMFAYRLRRFRNGERHIRGNRMNVRACIGLGILLFFLGASLVSAQTAGTGALTGTVTDSTGGRIPGV